MTHITMRKPDIVIRNGGVINLSANVVSRLDLREGDVISLMEDKSECYIYVPAAIELSSASQWTEEPYINEMAVTSGKTISYMVNDSDRKRTYADGSTASYYWTRSPSTDYTTRICVVDSSGYIYYYSYGIPTSSYGVLIEISF